MFQPHHRLFAEQLNQVDYPFFVAPEAPSTTMMDSKPDDKTKTLTLLATTDPQKADKKKVYFWSLQLPHLLRHIVSYLHDFGKSAFPPLRNRGVTFFANRGTKSAAAMDRKLETIMIRLPLRRKVISAVSSAYPFACISNVTRTVVSTTHKKFPRSPSSLVSAQLAEHSATRFLRLPA